jgi:hypothetical protein
MENKEKKANIENQQLWKKIPLDLLYNHIIPYTYQKIDTNLLNDIRNFFHDYRIIINYYYFDMNEYFLIHDLLLFCSNGGISFKITQDNSLINFFNRNIIFKKLPLNTKYNYIQLNFYHNLTSKVEQKIKFLFSLLTPNERACFINKHIIDEYE